MKNLCFLCKEPSSTSESLHKASTFRLDARARKCALDLQDDRLLAMLSAGDLVAQDVLYHALCLESLYNSQSALYLAQEYNLSSYSISQSL